MSEDNKQVEEVVEETTETTEQETQKSLEELSTEELEALVKEKENAAKEARQSADESLKRQQLAKRLEKAEAKVEKSNEIAQTSTEPKKPDLDPNDIFDLREAGYTLDSEEAQKILSSIERGEHKSVAQALANDEVQAVLGVIKQRKIAAATIDENDSEELIAQTKKEVFDNYKLKGEVPMIDGKPDPEAIKTISKAQWDGRA